MEDVRRQVNEAIEARQVSLSLYSHASWSEEFESFF